MIDQDTVLVLGAGASVEFGFPSGLDLTKKIIERCRPDNWGNQMGGNLRIGQDIAGQIGRLGDEFRFSGLASIDSFLERRPDFMECGKWAIAMALVPLESESRLFPIQFSGSWYHYLFQRLNDQCDTLERFSKNRIAFLTYNYDRSLEHFLTKAVSKTYKVDESEAWKALKNFRVIHIHGAIGPYDPSFAGPHRRYQDTLDFQNLSVSARGIIVLHESSKPDETLSQARSCLAAASHVCFLGFAYHREAVRRLLPESWAPGKRVVGSCYGMTDPEWGQVAAMIPRIQPAARDHKCLDVLRNEFFLI